MLGTNQRVLSSAIVISLSLILTGCGEKKINTSLQLLEEVSIVEENQISEQVSTYFEREAYSADQVDEMFYIVENHSDQPIEVSEFYFVQKLVDDEWITLDNNTIENIDTVVSVLPGRSTEFIFWSLSDSSVFDKGTYRLYTRVNFFDENSAEDEVLKAPKQVRDIYIPFEIL